MKGSAALERHRVGEPAAADVGVTHPLVLDLDGTLLRTDLLLEAALAYLKRHPLRIFVLLFWLCRGIAHLKHQLALRTEIVPELLPLNEALVSYATDAAAQGRTVVVATAANRRLAEAACGRLDFVSEVIASCDQINLKGHQKAALLKARFPEGFAYAGDCRADLPVWRVATSGVFAGRDGAVRRSLTRVTSLEADCTDPAPNWRHWLRALRLHQWAKNVLLFLPLLLAGRILDVGTWLACAAAFLALGLTASGTYIINDLLDLEADRQHWSKRRRPFAAGDIGIRDGVLAAGGLLASGLTIAVLAGGSVLLSALLLYSLVSLSYSLHLKRIPVLDVILIASLFTLRLVIGALAADVRLSSWLLVFSMFLFTSLALAKRATEMGRGAVINAAKPSVSAAAGRGYVAADTVLVGAMGVATAVAAIQVMVLYLIHDAFEDALYRAPQLLWAVPVLIGLWLGRIWLLSGRGLLDDDPVVFAIGDRISIALGFGVVASFAGAALLR